mmetsp:Transcript_759/g.2131  ORF Transcript_759/g.2131 Transcript_759/m.2131 type:complete len:200 (+) Transcript_759:333-932(+)
MKRQCWKKPARWTEALVRVLPPQLQVLQQQRRGGTVPEGPGARATRRPDRQRRHRPKPPPFPTRAREERARRPRRRRLHRRAVQPLPPKLSPPHLEKATKTMISMPTTPRRPRSPLQSVLGRGLVVSVWLRPPQPGTSRRGPPSQDRSSRSSTRRLCSAAGWMASTESVGGIDCSPLPMAASWVGGTVCSPSAWEPMLV